ncbi:hypothetical protein HXX01_02860 [Candidatus Nomurabacteria bacterium]|nr:hypothetical protein [Candidatus Nomurabacteria bacterium]
MEKQCMHCYKPFEAIRSSAQYCSDSCKTLACRARKATEKANALYNAKKKEAEELLEKEKIAKKAKREAKKEQKQAELKTKNTLIAGLLGSLEENALKRKESQLSEVKQVEAKPMAEPQTVVNEKVPASAQGILKPLSYWEEERKKQLARQAELYRYQCLGEITAAVLFKISDVIFSKKS